MPMSYSIAYGLIAGIITYIILNTIVWVIEMLSGGRIVPYAKEFKEPWTWRIVGGILPGWLTRLFSGKRDFWRPHEHVDGEVTEHVGGAEDKEINPGTITPVGEFEPDEKKTHTV
jgi:AGZA family xanthine/uracil permease-like MFS transporter